MITGINHILISVKNLEESFLFYTKVLGFKPKMKSPTSAYLLAGELWFCLEEDQSVRQHALPEYTHIALNVSQNDFDEVKKSILNSNATIFKENKSEGDSLYFIDPNGHKFEIHVGTLESRLAHYKKNLPDKMTLF